LAELSGSNYSETNSSNNATAPDGWPEGMKPSDVNNADRSFAGAVKRFWNRINGAYASTGSSNAYVLTPDVDLAAYVTGERYSFRSNFANTGSATLNISSLGAKTIKKFANGATSAAALTGGEIQSGQSVTVEYDGTDLILVTPSGQAIDNINALTEDTTPAIDSDYVATYDASATGPKKVKVKNLRSQATRVTAGSATTLTDNAWTAITWDAETFDDGSWWASTPNPTRVTVTDAGRYRVNANMQLNTSTAAPYGIRIKQSGTVVAQHVLGLAAATGAGGQAVAITGLFVASASDYFEIEVFQKTGGSVATLASTSNTWVEVERVR
jgi:hypothetical protein